MKALVVTNTFPGHPATSIITDPQTIEEILASEHAGHVHVVELPDRPNEPSAD